MRVKEKGTLYQNNNTPSKHKPNYVPVIVWRVRRHRAYDIEVKDNPAANSNSCDHLELAGEHQLKSLLLCVLHEVLDEKHASNDRWDVEEAGDSCVGRLGLGVVVHRASS